MSSRATTYPKSAIIAHLRKLLSFQEFKTRACDLCEWVDGEDCFRDYYTSEGGIMTNNHRGCLQADYDTKRTRVYISDETDSEQDTGERSALHTSAPQVEAGYASAILQSYLSHYLADIVAEYLCAELGVKIHLTSMHAEHCRTLKQTEILRKNNENMTESDEGDEEHEEDDNAADEGDEGDEGDEKEC
jgi:hypothetical protein